MRPTPIPDTEVWEGATRKVLAAPDGDLANPDIAPVEALVDRSPSTGALNLSVRCVLEDDDLAKLIHGGTVWLTFWGGMVPWSASVVAPAGYRPPGPLPEPGVNDVDLTADKGDCDTTGRHEHHWRRPRSGGPEQAVVAVSPSGVVILSEAVMAQLMTDAGWERAR
jgi:hypothetical protein